MKTHIDFFSTIKGEFLAAKRFRSRLIRFWGTETIGGVKVMKKRFDVYPNTTTNPTIRQMCKLLGVWGQIKRADFSAIAGYYFYFNPNKNIASTNSLNAILLAEKIDSYCAKDEWKYTTINYIDKSNPTRFDGYTKEQILSYIDNDYRRIFDLDNGFVAGNTILESTIGKYVLFDDGTEFDVKVISSQVTSITPSIADVSWYSDPKRRTRYTGLSISLKFRKIVSSISESGIFIEAIMAEQSEYHRKLTLTMQDSIGIHENFWKVQEITNSVWYRSQLRYSVIIDKKVKTIKILQLILGFIDTGKVDKSVSFWKRILGVILIVVAIVIGVVTAGAGAPVSALLSSIALYVGMAVLIMVVIQKEWSKNNAAAAAYMGRWIQVGNAIGMLAGITSVINSLGTALSEEAARESATQAIASSSGTSLAEATITTASLSSAQIAAINTAMNVTAEVTVNTIVTVGKNMLTSAIGSSWQSISMNIAKVAVSMRQKDMESKLEAKTEQAKEMQEEVNRDADKSMSMGLEDLQRYTDNTDRIWTRYDYDSIYGPTPSVMHIGNIQKASSYKGTGLNLRAEDLV